MMGDIEELMKRGDVRGAGGVAERRLAVDPDDGEALLVRARVHMADGEMDEAAELISRAEDLDVEEALVWKAVLAAQIEHPEAFELLREACEAARRPEPFFVLGRLHNERKEFAAARPYLERALELSPDQPVAHFQLSYALMEMGEVDKGMRHLERCLELAPQYTPAYLVFSRLLEGNGRPQDARYLIEQGLKIQPDDEDLRQELARLRA